MDEIIKATQKFNLKGVSDSARVLMSDGTYKRVSKVLAGEEVIDMDGRPVRVSYVKKHITRDISFLKTSNWHSAVYFADSTNVLLKDYKTGDTFWAQVGNLKANLTLEKNNFLYKALPKDIYFKFGESLLKQSYEMGLLVGLYLGYGNVHNDWVEFKIGNRIKIIEDFLKKMNVQVLITTVLKCFDKNMYDLFLSFGNKANRTLPVEYRSSDQDYVKGLYDGMTNFNSQKNYDFLITMSLNLCEVMYYVCNILDLRAKNLIVSAETSSQDFYFLYVDHKEPMYAPAVEQVHIGEPVFLFEIVTERQKGYVVNDIIIK